MRQSKRELFRQIEELDDDHGDGPGRIRLEETVVGTEWGPEDNAGEVIAEETTVFEL